MLQEIIMFIVKKILLQPEGLEIKYCQILDPSFKGNYSCSEIGFGEQGHNFIGFVYKDYPKAFYAIADLEGEDVLNMNEFKVEEEMLPLIPERLRSLLIQSATEKRTLIIETGSLYHQV